MHVMPATLRSTTASRSLALARDALLFTACYVALDWASYIYPLGPFNITPWNPPPALSIVWMMLGGLHYAPVVFVAAVIADFVIRGAPGGLAVTIATSLVLAAGYAAIAAALRHFFKSDVRLRDTRQLWIFSMVSAGGTALVAALYVGVLWTAGFPVGESFASAAFRFWLGDTVGILVTAPLLLVAVDAVERERLVSSWRKPETLLQFSVMAAAVVFVFRGVEDAPSKYFYVLFLPLIWIASRGGLVGAILASAVVQVGVVLGAHGGTVHSLAILDLQALVAALTLTGLFLGVMVDERERAAEGLRRSLRLAAAGEMAGAIAHEINQPLAALANYGRACQLLLERGESAIPRAELQSAIGRMLGESKRAADVVTRLREFFRTGTTRLAAATVAGLLDSARQMAAALDAPEEIEFAVENDAAAPPLMVDRLQIELVLRNLIANAFQSVARQPAGSRKVTVSAHQVDGGRVLFRIADSGPGVPRAQRARLFEPFSGSKPTGMGLGLAISRAIAEAHGGSLTMASTEPTEFHLVLPSVVTDG
jgi:two-component system, LuxR family, sensor kinase FixL